MFKGRSMGLLVVAALLAGGAAWIANQWATNRSVIPQQLVSNEHSMVVAAIDIPYGQKVEEQHVKLVTISKDFIPSGAFSSKDEVIGRVAKSDTIAGDILRDSRFVEHLEGSTLASLIGVNKRAISVRVDDVIGVSGFLLPGNRVDILATHRKDKKYLTDTVLRDIKVLAIDQSAATKANEPVIVRAVTLEVDSKQAEVVVKASNEGSIQLALRNPNELTVAEVKKKPVVKKAVRRSYTPRTNVIRGTQVSTVRH
jgi:pilus assembly protein CpaB